MFRVNVTKGMYATEDIPEGTIILKEKHFVSCLIPNIRKQKSDLHEIITCYVKQPVIFDTDGNVLFIVLSYILEKMSEYPTTWLTDLTLGEEDREISEVEKKNIYELVFNHRKYFKTKYNLQKVIKIYKTITNHCTIQRNFSGAVMFAVIDTISCKINNACHNNANIIYFPEHTIIIASKPIKAGEEITANLVKKLPRGKCKCDLCSIETESDVILKEVRKREESKDFDGRKISVSKYIGKYLDFGVFGGIEMYYHVFYENILDQQASTTRMIMVPMMQIQYSFHMCHNLAEFYGIDKKEVLSYFMLCTPLIHDKFFDGALHPFLKANFTQNLTFDIEEDVRKFTEEAGLKNEKRSDTKLPDSVDIDDFFDTFTSASGATRDNSTTSGKNKKKKGK